MKRSIFTAKCLLSVVIAYYLLPTVNCFAGNPNRAGSAGASELLINPWARSSGWGEANMASVRGLEAVYSNVAGLAFTKKTEILFAHTRWFRGTGIDINAFGFSQRVGETGVLGLGIMSMTFGDIEKTTVDIPEGGIGYFSPTYMNLGLSYSKEFSRSIYGGMTLKVITEKISDVSASGVAFDAGIQYVTGIVKGQSDNLKFGISLKNVGPGMSYRGDGLSFREVLSSNQVDMTVEQRSAKYELPSCLNVGVSYDFYLGGSDSLEISPMHRITAAINFRSNSFIKDQYMLGVEYGYKSFLMLRVGFTYENGIFKTSERTTVLTGPSAGITFEIPLGKENGTTFGLDYSYRATNPFQGVHTIGARINI